MGLDEIRRVIREVDPLRPSMRVKSLDKDARTTTAKRRHVDPMKLPGLLRGDLDWIVMKCLEKDRRRRYETANGLAQDLKRHLACEPVFARPASPLYRFRRMVRRNKLAFAAGFIVTVALLGGFGFSIRSFLNEQKARRLAESERNTADEQRQRAETSEAYARRRSYVSDIQLAFQALHAKQFGRARRLLDAHRPKVPGDRDLRGWEWRWLWQELRGEAIAILARSPQRASSVSFSPDGGRVAAGYSDGRVEVCDIAGARTPQVLQANGPSAIVAFSPVENALIFNAKDGFIMRHDFATRSERVFAQAPAQVHDFAFSRDGAVLAVLTEEKGRTKPPTGPAARTVPGAEAGGNGVVALVIDGTDGRTLHTVALPEGTIAFFNNVRISPDHALLYVTCGAFKKPRLRCVRLEDGQTLWEEPAPTTPDGRQSTGFSAMALSPDGQVLATATGYYDHTIQIWDAGSGHLLETLSGHGDYVTDLAFSPNGRTLASTSADETVRLWDTQSYR